MYYVLHYRLFVKYFVIFLVLAISFFSCKSEKKVKSPVTLIEPTRAIIEDTISLIAVGDVMTGSGFPSPINLAADSSKSIFNNVKHILQNADITFGNLEGCIADSGEPKKKCSESKTCYIFRMPELSAEILKKTGFDFMNIANNHIGDFGKDGIISTMNALNKNNIKFSGIPEVPYQIIERKGLKIGFAGFSNNMFTNKMNDYTKCEEILKELKQKVDIIVVSFHGGGEGIAYRNITKDYEMFLNSNRGNPYKFARKMIDAGADLVIGHGPHLTRAVDIYKGKFIAYSLGNFATYKKFNLNGLCGIAPIIKINIDKNGDFINAEVTSIIQKSFGIPFIDPQNKAYTEIINLTREDIGNCDLEFINNGIYSAKRSNFMK